jgi:hypothetical protein
MSAGGSIKSNVRSFDALLDLFINNYTEYVFNN